MNPHIEITIDELILHGFSKNSARRIQMIVENELTNLITMQGIPPALSSHGIYSEMDGGNFERGVHSKDEITGRQIAKSVFEGFSNASPNE